MKCLNLNIPQFRQAVAVLGQARATEVINTFDEGYLPTINEIIDRHNTMPTGYSVPSGTGNKLSIDQKVTLEQTGELLTPAEAAKMYEDYVPQSFFKLLRSWFFKVPTTNSNEANGIKIVDSAYLAYKTGREAYGAFIDGVIYLANLGTNEDVRVNKDTLKHELVHKIM